MIHTFAMNLLIATSSTVFAWQDSTPRDLEAEYDALIAGASGSDRAERSTSEQLFELADALEVERSRRVLSIGQSPDDGPSAVEFFMHEDTDDELRRDGHPESEIRALRELVAWYAHSEHPARLDELIRTGPPTLPPIEWKPLDPFTTLDDLGLGRTLRAVALAEFAHALYRAERGEHEAFARSVERLLALDTMMHERPSTLSDLIRFAAQGLGLRAVLESIERGWLNPEHAEELQQLVIVAEERHTRVALHHLRGERLIALSQLGTIMEQAGADDAAAEAAGHLEGAFERVEEFLRAPTIVDDLPETDLPGTVNLTRTARSHASAALTHLARFRAARLALAIEHHRATTGALPEELDTLVDAGLLETLPANTTQHDPTFGYTLDDRSPTGYTLALRRTRSNEPLWIIPSGGIEEAD